MHQNAFVHWALLGSAAWGRLAYSAAIRPPSYTKEDGKRKEGEWGTRDWYGPPFYEKWSRQCQGHLQLYSIHSCKFWHASLERTKIRCTSNLVFGSDKLYGKWPI